MKRPAIQENSAVTTFSSNKTLLIVAITIGALIVLGLLLFFGKQFVGKAIATTTVTTLTQRSTASIPITVNMETSQARSYYFELAAMGVTLCSGGSLASGVSITSGYGASGFSPQARCQANDILIFEDTFVPPISNLAAPGPTGEVTLATISFIVPMINQITFHFNVLEVTDENNMQVISGQGDIVLPVTSGGGVTSQLSLTSTAFIEGGSIPAQYTCDADDDGVGVSLPLTINNIPAGTQSLAIIMDDISTNPSTRHWMLLNIPPTIQSIGEGVIPTGSVETISYTGPCPPEREEHSYTILVQALSISNAQGVSIQESDILAQNTLTGKYTLSTPPTVECPADGTCPAVGDLFAALDQPGRIALCTEYGIPATTCPGTSTFNADINGDTLIDDRDALFIFQAIEAKQSAYNYCGAADQPPCVFGDRAICEDVSYVWIESTDVTNPPALPTQATSTTLSSAGILCGSLEADSS